MLYTSTIQGCFPATEISTARARKRTAVSSVVAPCEDTVQGHKMITEDDAFLVDIGTCVSCGKEA